MRAPLKWLARYVELDRAADELARLLTASGTEVAGVERLGAQWEGLAVAEILKVEKHPNADRLSLATVNVGSQTLTVVCGAPNIAAGQKVPFAPVGAKIQGHVLEARPIRGIPSEGMLCAPDEIGLSPDHSGILVLDANEVPGRPLSEALGDDVLVLEVTPNRSDCLSMIGIAREIAVLTRTRLHLPSAPLRESGARIEGLFKVRVDDAELCPRFVARLTTGVQVGPSPWWMQSLLHAAGVRSINNVVDVTNFIMLEWGNPLHAYDYDALRGQQIIVRRAHEGELLTTLDGVQRQLAPDMLVIADAHVAIGLAGIMGGAESEVKDSTKNILLESANFDPVTMRKTARHLGMHSEAVRRFERGVDPTICSVAADHASFWFSQLAGGTIAPGSLDVDSTDHAPRSIVFDGDETGRLLGKRYPDDEIEDTLSRLGFGVDREGSSSNGHSGSKHPLTVTVPSWRLDVRQPADLVEEVARIVGYDDLPMTMPEGAVPLVPAQDPAWTRRLRLEDRLREILKGAGFSEVVTYTLLPSGANSSLVVDQEDTFQTPSLLTSLFIEPLKLANPMSEEQECLRTSMLPSLLTVYRTNRRHETHGLKFFEIGRVYWQRLGDLPEERHILAFLAAGPWNPKSWNLTDQPAQFGHVKGQVELIAQRLGLDLSFEAAEHPALHPGRTAQFTCREDLIGYAGELHPLVRQRLDLPADAVQVVEIDLDALARHANDQRTFAGIRRFPAVARQLTVAVAPSISAERVREIIVREGGGLLVDVALADVFHLPDGRRSLSYMFTLQSDERTLTDEEANALRDEIVAALAQEIGAAQR